MIDDTCYLHGYDPNQTEEVVWQLLLEEENGETVYKMPTFVLLCLLMMVGLPGNILVLLVYGFKFPASTTKSFIVAMAFFDLINCVIGMPFEMIDLRYDVEFNIPVACKIIRFCISLSACGSVTVLVAVSVDRFRRICRAFHKQMTVKQSKVVIGALTLACVLFSIPALVLYGRHTEIRHGVKMHDCSIDDSYKSGSIAAAYQYMLGGTWIISIVVLIFMYSFIIYKIQLQKKRREKLSNYSCDSTILTKLQVLSPDRSSSENQKDPSCPDYENRSLVKYADVSVKYERRDSEEANKCLPKPENGAKRRRGSSSLLNRLFSRDVNPVLVERDTNYEDEYISHNARLINYTRRSYNHYPPESRDLELNKKPQFVFQESIPEENIDTTTGDENALQPDTTDGSVLQQDTTYESSLQNNEANAATNSDESHTRCSNDKQMNNPYLLEAPEGSNAGENSDYDNFPQKHDCLRTSEAENADHCIQNQKMQTSSLPIIKTFGNEEQPDQCYNNPPELEKKFCNIINGVRDDAELGHIYLSSETKKTFNSHSLTNDLNNPSKDIPCIKITQHSDPHQVDYSQTTRANEQSYPAFLQPHKKMTKSPSMDTTISMKKKKKSFVREIKTSKVSFMMLMVTLGFVLSYLPHLGIQVFKNMFPNMVNSLLCSNHTYFVFHHFLMRSFFINNAINPIIYSFYNKTFRDRCLRLLKSPRSLLLSSEHRLSHIHSVSQDNDTA